MSSIVQPLEMIPLADGPADASPLLDASEENPLHRVMAKLQVCIGEVSISVGELLQAREQQVVRLDRAVSEPVDLLLEGQVVARGELVALDDQFAVRITELPVRLRP